MAWSLVGSAGAISGEGAGANWTPAWGTGEERTAGNLLVLFVAGNGPSFPTIPFGWGAAMQSINGSVATSSIFYRIATGGEAAPEVEGVAGSAYAGQLMEFSPPGDFLVLDQAGSAVGSVSPLTGSNFAADPSSGDLVLALGAVHYSSAATKTFGMSFNSATATEDDTGGEALTDHVVIGYGVTTGNGSADSAALTFPTGGTAALSLASFRTATFPL